MTPSKTRQTLINEQQTPLSHHPKLEKNDSPITYKDLNSHDCYAIDIHSILMTVMTFASCLLIILISGCSGEIT